MKKGFYVIIILLVIVSFTGVGLAAKPENPSSDPLSALWDAVNALRTSVTGLDTRISTLEAGVAGGTVHFGEWTDTGLANSGSPMLLWPWGTGGFYSEADGFLIASADNSFCGGNIRICVESFNPTGSDPHHWLCGYGITVPIKKDNSFYIYADSPPEGCEDEPDYNIEFLPLISP